MTGRLDPRELAALIGAEVAPDARPADRISFDSRDADERTAFAALPGATSHGNRFVLSALERGTPFVLGDLAGQRAARVPDPVAALRRWARQRRERSGARIVGITGSAGKTTAKEFAAAALEAISTPGNLNTLNALACHLLSRVDDAPLHVVEMGIDRPGEMDELVSLVGPDLGVVTAVGPAHLEALGSIDGVAREKGRLIHGRPGLVCEQASAWYPGVPAYGFAPGVEHRGEDLRAGPDRVGFRYAGQRTEIKTPSLAVAGAALLGLALAREHGLDLASAAERVRAVRVPGGRMRVERGRITLVDDAYNANPLSVAAALDALARLPGRRVAILGDMRELGPHAERYHAEAGALAGRAARVVLAVGAHAERLATEAALAGARTEAVETASDALAMIDGLVEDGDAVLVKASNGVGLAVVAEALRARL